MRPTLRLLEDPLVDRILDEARTLIAELGVEIHNPGVLALLGDHGARVDLSASRAWIPGTLVDRALATAPGTVPLYDALGTQTHDLGGDRVYFTPGSAAIHVLDGDTCEIRTPHTADYVRYVKVVGGLKHIAAQSTAFIPADVPSRISDSYRLYLSLLHGEKPVVTGAFTIEAFEVMRDLQVAVRGSEAALREKPLTIFSCCPTAPVKWSDVTSQNVVDCGRAGIPVEFVSMPLSGFMAPVTLVGSVVQHAAETLSGVVISQLAAPGAPMLWGGSPAIFDVRYETTPMGAVETMMLDCANAEVGKRLGCPRRATSRSATPSGSTRRPASRRPWAPRWPRSRASTASRGRGCSISRAARASRSSCSTTRSAARRSASSAASSRATTSRPSRSSRRWRARSTC